MKERAPTTITQGRYLQLLGMHALAQRYNEQLRELQKMAAEIVNERDEDGRPELSGHMGDAMFGAREIDEALEILRITVVDAPPADPQP
jgi:hypothetical protein